MVPEYENDGDMDVSIDNYAVARFDLGIHALNYIAAGNSCFTLVSLKSGNRFTYRVKRAKNATEEGSPLFVYIMHGRNKVKPYDHIGTIFSELSDYKVWHRTFFPRRNMNGATVAVSAFVYAFNYLRECKLPKDCEVWRSSRCGRCNKLITNPTSLLTGYGPECYATSGRFGNVFGS